MHRGFTFFATTCPNLSADEYTFTVDAVNRHVVSFIALANVGSTRINTDGVRTTEEHVTQTLVFVCNTFTKYRNEHDREGLVFGEITVVIPQSSTAGRVSSAAAVVVSAHCNKHLHLSSSSCLHQSYMWLDAGGRGGGGGGGIRY